MIGKYNSMTLSQEMMVIAMQAWIDETFLPSQQHDIDAVSYDSKDSLFIIHFKNKEQS